MNKETEQDIEKVISRYAGEHAHCSIQLSGQPPFIAGVVHICAKHGANWTTDDITLMKNTAGQVIKSPTSAQRALESMEWRLQAAFNEASHPLAVKDDFLKLAAEVEEDVKKISAIFKIVSGGKYGTEQYEMIVGSKKTGFFKRENITLAQAVRIIKKDA